MKHTIIALVCLLLTPTAQAIEERTPHYRATGGELVCLDGTNRYTRALYGGPSAFRLETSDRPIFALYRKGACRNVRFFLVDGGQRIALDSTAFTCEARYTGGRRTYLLTRGSATIGITALAAYSHDAALWRIRPAGLSRRARIEVRVCMSRGSKFRRNGDLGVDDLTLFDPSPREDSLATATVAASGETYIHVTDGGVVTTYNSRTGARIYNKEERERVNTVSRLAFSTPDSLLNALGPILMHAADGLWDGETWQHGCVGWRMPLAGWRGCYVGDAVGWHDRSLRHFRAYAQSQVTNRPPREPHPTQDTAQYLTRAAKRWGTQMYSDGYICRYPGRTNVMHHYDMNLNYIDGLLHHLSYCADTARVREFWPVVKRHLAWERRNFDPDGDHLYDAYCCIWASDALYYSGGAVTHSSAYNYRANRLAARMAEIAGDDPQPYRAEADSILTALNSRLWLPTEGHWAEYQDYMGLRRVHPAAALWSIYTPIDCEACTPRQAWEATRYVDGELPHIYYKVGRDTLFTLSTTNWHPYAWSTNNVAHEEVANMALAYFQAGRADEGYRLLLSDLTDEMLLGLSPGNFGQISHFDRVVKEAYRDFGDNVGITSRAIVNGLFGIRPDALNGRCVVQPSLPKEWRECSVRTPSLSYTLHRDGTRDIYEIEQHFRQPLRVTLRVATGPGTWQDYDGTTATHQTITVDRATVPDCDWGRRHSCLRDWGRRSPDLREIIRRQECLRPQSPAALGLDAITPGSTARQQRVDISPAYNASVTDIFRSRYLSPRPPYTTLQISERGIGQWCHPDQMAVIDDSGLRAVITPDSVLDTHQGLTFRIPKTGQNIAFTSLWDNYPDSIDIDLQASDWGRRHSCLRNITRRQKCLRDTERRQECLRPQSQPNVAAYSAAYLLMAGTTQNMQSRIDNALVIALYADGTRDTLRLRNPENWPTINEAYMYDNGAFHVSTPAPLRLRFDNAAVGRDINAAELLPPSLKAAIATPGQGSDLMLSTEREIHGGAAVILKMPLNPAKPLKALRLRTLSNDIVVGLMGVTLEKP